MSPAVCDVLHRNRRRALKNFERRRKTESPPGLCQFSPAADKPMRNLWSAECQERPFALQKMGLLFSLSHVTDAGINDAVYLGRDWFDRTEERCSPLRHDTRTFERQ